MLNLYREPQYPVVPALVDLITFLSQMGYATLSCENDGLSVTHYRETKRDNYTEQLRFLIHADGQIILQDAQVNKKSKTRKGAHHAKKAHS